MWKEKILAGAFLALAGTATAVQAADKLKEDLQRVAQLRIFFGHQSVGNNVLDGVQKLAQSESVPLKVQKVPSAAGVPAGVLGHAPIAENRKPLMKLQSFSQAMGEQAARVDVALMKFCYLDIDADTDAKILFARYRTTVDTLRAKHPGTVFVHVTAPLTIAQTGPKALIKRLIGRAPYGSAENVRREEYNTLLRQTYQGKEPVFDIARIESADPQGGAATVEWQGKTVPAMTPVLTDDGGHLNEAGRLRAARELISVLAGAVAARPSTVAATR
jgi:hypothetical protein